MVSGDNPFLLSRSSIYTYYVQATPTWNVSLRIVMIHKKKAILGCVRNLKDSLFFFFYQQIYALK